MLTRHLRWRSLPALVALAGVVATLSAGAQAPSTTGRGLIWEITREGRTSWLVGSLHVLTPEHYPLPEAMEQAFRRSETLVEEVDVAELESPQMMAALMLRGFYTGGESLDTQLPPETWALVSERATRLELSLDMVRRMRPWMAGLTLVGLQLQRAGFEPEHGIDHHFRRKATETGKAFQALEAAEQQIDYLAGFAPDVQERLLRSSLEDTERQMREVDALVAAWRGGDTEALERLLLDAFRDSPEVYQTLIVERNRRWMPAVEACIQRSSCFIVVGAGHTVGDDGLVAMLRQRDYQVVQR